MSIRLLTALLLTLFAGPIAWAQGMPGSDETLIATSLVAHSKTPAAGQTTTLAIVMEPQGDWHGYWKQPGDAGLAPRLTWHLPEGVSAGEPAYPVPQTLLIDGLMNHVYEHPYALLVPLEVAANLPHGQPLPIRLDMAYLACRHDACVPERASLELQLTVGQGQPDDTVRDAFATWRQALPRPLGSPAHFQVENDVFRLSIPLPAAQAIEAPHLFALTPGAIDHAAEQRISRDGDLLIIETAAGKQRPDSFDAVLALGNGLGLELHATPQTASASDTLGLTLVALAGAVLGGVLLNLMPCVFPILSLKALSIARANSSAGTAHREALAYTGGVVLVCVALGALLLALRAGGSQLGWAFQLQDPRVILVLLLLTSAIALNLAGLFELSSVDVGGELAASKGSRGAFWTGALAAFVATPCSGPFMAAALGTALVLPPVAAMLVFAGLGIGIALPFLLLGFIPPLRRRLPKPGPWMTTLRHVLAVPMFLTALALTWVLSQQVGSTALVVGIGCTLLLGLGLWACGLRQRALKSRAWLPAALAGVLALGIGLAQDITPPASAIPAEHQPFDETRLNALRQGEQAVFVYFTADWCVTCKVNEQVAIQRDETHRAFQDANVVVMRGDWTRGDAAITAFLERHGRSGVPLYLWYHPGQAEPQVLPQLLSPGLLSELSRR
ncbi:protein-disulfide reductase DsbD domain-containing protein [Pseudomonas sp. GD03944]|uniref:protein-disulfide reductase DsbD family protein n=1 Tax=Pseudomonas sp. GD03944 TaxID=2975409 RepID=UPI0024496F09|nr:protein-disulfide reductase DsbD domain-containing protein [Pseudomonas sp. GD03944]MDH1265275.1 protein-disulfide reductase DsbD family protein [Pseudomonas sp. GD03944]